MRCLQGSPNSHTPFSQVKSPNSLMPACPRNCGFVDLPESQIDGHVKHSCILREVQCPNNCGAPPLIANKLRDHLAQFCPLRLKQCRHGCGQELPVSALVQHEVGECEFRPVNCELCDGSIRAKDMREHTLKHCPERPVRCERGCGTAALTASRLQTHLDKECPLRTETCQFCDESMMAGSMLRHSKLECPWRLVPCPNNCSTKPVPDGVRISGAEYHGTLGQPDTAQIRLAVLDVHLRDECPERLEDCPYGCLQPNGRVTTLRALSVKRHTEALCPNRPVRCEDCGAEMKYHELKAHVLNTCPERELQRCLYTCKYGCGLSCGKTGIKAKDLLTHRLYDCLHEHELNCPKKTAPCRLCGQYVVLADRLVHEASECPERQVLCGLGCGARMRAKELSNHQGFECMNRLVECVRCGQEVIAQEMSLHLESQECAQPCSMKCGAVVRPSAMAQHHRIDCPNYFVECKYQCGAPVPATEIRVHEQQECPYRIVPEWVHNYAKPHTASPNFCRHCPSPRTPRPVEPEAGTSPVICEILALVD